MSGNDSNGSTGSIWNLFNQEKKITQNMIYLVRLLVHLEKKIRRENLEIISSLKVVRGSDLC